MQWLCKSRERNFQCSSFGTSYCKCNNRKILKAQMKSFMRREQNRKKWASLFLDTEHIFIDPAQYIVLYIAEVLFSPIKFAKISILMHKSPLNLNELLRSASQFLLPYLRFALAHCLLTCLWMQDKTMIAYLQDADKSQVSLCFACNAYFNISDLAILPIVHSCISKFQ